MRNLFTCVLLISFFLPGCKKKSPEYIIPRDTFKEILIDLHMADGIYMMNYGKYYTHTDSVNYYNTIFNNYGYSRAQFDSTLKYYTKNPVKFDLIYDGVINRLNILEQQLTQSREFENDSVENLYKGKTKWELPKDNKYTRIPFDIIIQDSADYSINVYARKYPDDESKKLRITAFFWYLDSASGKFKMEKFPELSYSNDKFFTLLSTSKRYHSKQKAHLRGWICNYDKQSKPFKRHINIKVIFIKKKQLFPKR